MPRERTPWHWSKHVKFRPSWLFHKGCLSLHSCQTAMLPHVGKLNSASSAVSNFQHSFEQWVQLFHHVLSFENSHWAGLGRFLGRCLRNHRKTLVSSVYLCLFSWEGFPKQTCKNHLRWKQGCKLIDQSQTVDCIAIILRQPWEELAPWERTPWHWSQNAAVSALWIIRIQFQDVFGEVEVLFGSHKPLILSVGKAFLGKQPAKNTSSKQGCKLMDQI